ncbi:MAG: CPBP family intramembrane metalloprotease [Spirochaetes bacterium]|nr:CPBP family intramembrane metalloprotease [Spirochaetota bacterium]
MVRLDNPYSFHRPQPVQYLFAIGLFLIAFIIKKYTTLPFLYQFTIPIMVTLLLAYISDNTVLSKKMILGGEFAELGRIYFFIVPAIAALALVLFKKISNVRPHFYLQLTSNGETPLVEFVPLVMFFSIPSAEIVFRGFFQYLWSHLFGKKAGCIITACSYSILFVVLSTNIFVIVYATIMGAILTYIAYRESSVLPSILAHEIFIIVSIIFKF